MMQLLKKERMLKRMYLVGQFSAVDKRTSKDEVKEYINQVNN